MSVLSTPARLFEGLPDARGSHWRLAEHHAELGERVFHGVDDGRSAWYGAALAHALDAERVDDRAVLGERHRDLRHVVALGDGVVHEGARQELSALVVDQLFQEPGGDALDRAALELALDDRGIDRAPR